MKAMLQHFIIYLYKTNIYLKLFCFDYCLNTKQKDVRKDGTSHSGI